MRTTWFSILACTVLFCVAAKPRLLHGPGKVPAQPPLQPLMVGPMETITRPCDAIAVAQAGQEIDIAPGTYTDSCEITTAGLWIRGVGGQPKIDLSGTNHPADYKGIYVVASDNVTIDNLELTGAHIDDSEGGNAAALRVTGQGLIVHGCYIHDNQNGVLAAPTVDGGTITIDNTELSHNGLGDACDQGGCVHNVYISKTSATVRYDRTIFQYNWSHDLASDTADKGHLLKSRSRETDVLYNRITGEMGHDSYEVDIPNGGVGVVVGNVIEKGPNADNPTLLAYGEEGIDNPASDLYVVNNTFVNDFTSGTFISVAAGGTLTAHDNILYGPGTPSSTGALSADNLTGTDPLFVAPAAYDYHLQASSPAIGKGGVAVFEAATEGGLPMPLLPTLEYVQPLASVPRLTQHDLGAFEYGTVITGVGDDAGSSGSGDDAGGSGAGDDGGGLATSDAGASVGSSSGSSEGGASQDSGAAGRVVGGDCSCDAAGQRRDVAAGLAGLGLALLVALRRGRRAATQ
jgi:hypothetical protein